MNSFNGQIADIVSNIWNIMFSMPVEQVEPDPKDNNFFLTGAVKISGAWQGEVHVYCYKETVSKIAAKIFEKNSDALSKQEMSDTMSEITNMIGGNLKSILPSPSELSLPNVQFNAENSNAYHKEANLIDLKVGDERLRVEVKNLNS